MASEFLLTPEVKKEIGSSFSNGVDSSVTLAQKYGIKDCLVRKYGKMFRSNKDFHSKTGQLYILIFHFK